MEEGGRRGLRLRDIQIITKIWNIPFLPRWTPFHLLLNYPPLPNPLVLSPCVLSSLLLRPPLQILSQFDFFSAPYVSLRVASFFHLPSSPTTHSPSPLSSLFALSSLVFPSLFPLSLSPWGQSIAAVRGYASQLTLWHLSKLTPRNPIYFTPDIFLQCLFFHNDTSLTYVHHINTKL